MRATLTITFPYSIYMHLTRDCFAFNLCTNRSFVRSSILWYFFLMLMRFLINWFQVYYTRTLWTNNRMWIGVASLFLYQSWVSNSHSNLSLCLCHLLLRFHVLSKSLFAIFFSLFQRKKRRRKKTESQAFVVRTITISTIIERITSNQFLFIVSDVFSVTTNTHVGFPYHITLNLHPYVWSFVE